MNQSLLYKDKPLFGLDIGTSSIKVMQLGPSKKNQKSRTILGYGSIQYDKSAVVDGEIVEPELVAKAIKELFETSLIGDITTRRVAMSLPVARTYNRVLSLPVLKSSELGEAVRLEAEQYIPVPIDDLYIDYDIIAKTDKGIEVLLSAAPKKIVDSYMVLTNLLGLEIVALETSISASGRLVGNAENNDVPTILVDCGSLSVDITVYDKQLIVTGTISGGGDTFTELIAKKLDVSNQIAHTIKTKYGIAFSKKQSEIVEAIEPILSSLIKEIKKMVRYYEERDESEVKIGQVITLGGGANLPGLSEYLTDKLRLPARMCDPWTNIDFAKFQPPNEIEKTMYITVAGLALIDTKEIWND
jgi:type IV pilus assembly protein PilM